MMENNELNLKIALIRKQNCFALLTDVEVEVLANLLQKKIMKAGETIVSEGDPVDSFFLIAKGKADVMRVTYKNDLAEVESLANLSAENGDSIGLNETGFYSISGLRTATVVAITDMELYYVMIPLFHGYALSYPHVNEVMREQAEKFVDV